MRLPPNHATSGSALAASTHALDNGVSSAFKNGAYDRENWSSLIGIITAIVGNVLISFALNMQRYAHIRLDREWQEKERQRKKRSASGTSMPRLAESAKGGASRREAANENDPLISERRTSEDSNDSGKEEAYKPKSYLKSPYWWAGIILMTVGEAGNFLAYGFAPASIVSPLGVVALISNCIIAPFMLKEPFRARDALGVVIAVGGAVTVVLSASDNNPKLGPGEIWDLIRRWEFETYLGITVGVIIVLMVASNKYGDKNILIDLGLVGLFGGYTVLSTKGVSSLLSYRLWRVITFPVFYLLLVVLIFTAVMQIKYVNRALQRFDATQVIPVQFVLFTLSVILGSAILYRDFERTSGDNAGKFVGGCAMTFLGVWFITTGRPRRHDDDEDREPEPDDAISLAADPYHDSIDGSGEAGGSTPRSSTVRASSPTKQLPSYYRDDQDSRPTTPSINVMSEAPSLTRLPTTDLITSNPWASSSTSSLVAPPIERHTSTPILPSEAAPPPSSMAARSDPEIAPPRTPTRGKSHNEIPTTPITTPQLRRLRTNERGLGPLLASPLSTALSAMVQDLKRGGSFRGNANDGLGRRQSVLGLGTGDDGMGESLGRRRTHDALGEPLSRRSTRDEERSRESLGGGSGRGRSLSGTLNNIWYGMKGSRSREDVVGDEPGEDGGGI